MKSEKINLNKKIKIIWITLLGVLLLSILITIVPYSKYKKGQDLAVATMLLSTHEFDEYDNRKEIVRAMYNYFNRYYYGIFSGANKYISDAEDTLQDILESEGYTEGYGADHYLQYTNYFSYYLYKDFIFIILFSIICVIYIFLNIFYFLSRKVVITIDNNTINYQKSKGKNKIARLKDVTGVETTSLKGIKITGNGLKFKTLLVKNNNELKDYIMNLILHEDKKGE